MERCAYLLPLSAALMTMAFPQQARADDIVSVSLKGGRLADALRELSLLSGTGILFAPEVVGNRRGRDVVGRMRLESALRQLLWGTGLDFRRTSAGTIVVFAVPGAEAEGTDAAPAIPEILVVGHRTQNVDIRRTEMDIQPYQVATAHDLASSPADTVDQFFRTRLPSNAVSLPPSQVPSANFATNRSEVNLHGLGPGQTLVLVDGARMPSIPALGRPLFYQPDLNGLPLLAVDRIESLTATAGGIYGPGATGGIVNVVLKRDYRGADLSVNYGLTTRLDAPRRRIDGRIGFTPDSGRTDVMIAFSRSEGGGLDLASRAFPLAARALAANRDPAAFINSTTADGIIIQSLFGDNLSLKPSLGGIDLGTTFTFVPTGYSGIASDAGATLVANAGKAPYGLSPDSNGAHRSLVGHTETTSLLLTLRHRVSDGIEGFVDLVGYRNDSQVDGFSLASSIQLVDADAPTNPFGQTLFVTTPLPGIDGAETNRLGTFRASAGLIVRLPYQWRAEGSYSLGRVRNEVLLSGFTLENYFAAAVQQGVAGDGGEPVPDPFGSWDGYVAALQAYKIPKTIRFVLRNRFEDASLRMAGPLFTTAAGTTALSLSAEHRTEDVPATHFVTRSQDAENVTTFPTWRQAVSSLFGELRAPILARERGPWPLRGLELQLALRYDGIRSRVPEGANGSITAGQHSARQSALAYTTGLRFFPREHLMVRASLATGALPPQPYQLISFSADYGYSGASDRKRGGRIVGSEGMVQVLSGGSLRLLPERARSFSAGLVLNPDGEDRPRISLDYTRIEKRREISTVHGGDIAYFVNHEDDFPGRVTRAPLTVADRNAGFTAGVVTRVDATSLNIGRTTLDTIDVKLDYAFPVGSDLLRFYGAATWQPRLYRRLAPDLPAIDYVGFADGPLEWRGNAGVDWVHGRLSVAANGQYYHGYRAVDAEDAPDTKLDVEGVRIPAQFYIDISAAYRLRFPAATAFRVVDLRFGVANLFDKAPPVVTGNDLGYSYYGDARGRRFEATISAHF